MDPLVLTYSGFCLYPEVTTLQYEALHYIHPVVVMLLVGLFIGVGRLCPRFVIFSGSVAAQVLCYIILLSYTSLAETSLNILNPMTYLKTYPQTETHFTFVEIQPQTLYMDPTEHLPYALVAIVVEVLIIIPFALFVLFAPCLIRWVNLVRIKPLLDAPLPPLIQGHLSRTQYYWCLLCHGLMVHVGRSKLKKPCHGSISTFDLAQSLLLGH